MRQIILDTETTGLEPTQGHRVIEIGCVELLNRRLTGKHYHQYLNPDREIDAGALEVHGITTEFLQDKPRFEDVAETFLDFIKGAELIIHNAAFDLSFLNNELKLIDHASKTLETEQASGVIDTLVLARKMHPGQRNSLDALCKRYEIDNSQRSLHGALLDAEILADVYLHMTGGQTDLVLETNHARSKAKRSKRQDEAASHNPLTVLSASESELLAHQQWLQEIDKASDGQCVWLGHSAVTDET